jgi:hypothetical protein
LVFLTFYYAVSKKKHIFALAMNRLTHIFVWLSRINHCRGFGVQSPTDYRFVRYVVNEHWPYYQYDELGANDKWLKRKLGRLYFRLANWRQPATAVLKDYQDYIQAGCHRCRVVSEADKVEMAVVSEEKELQQLLPKCGTQSLLVLDQLYRHRHLWKEIVNWPQTMVTFDLYYCGIAFFDTKRTKQHYIINF